MHESCVPLRNHRARLRFANAHALNPKLGCKGFGWESKQYQEWDECRIGYMIRAIYLSTANSGMFLQNV
jgi:hypothetical protein